MDGSRRAIKTSSINHHSVLNCCPTNSQEPLYLLFMALGMVGLLQLLFSHCGHALISCLFSLRLVTGNMGSLTAALFIWLTVIVTPHLTQVRRSSKKQKKNISYFATSNTAGHSHSRLRRRPHNTPNRRKHFRMDGYYHLLLC